MYGARKPLVIHVKWYGIRNDICKDDSDDSLPHAKWQKIALSPKKKLWWFKWLILHDSLLKEEKGLVCFSTVSK
jgi:hypothetical protein